MLRRSVIVADRFYNDFTLLNHWDSNTVFFVIRPIENLKYDTLKKPDLPDDKLQHLMKDEIIGLANEDSKQKYKGKLRRVSVWNEDNKQIIERITNQLTWYPNTISEPYRARWQLEIFFRKIKQLLRIKSFVVTSENAVMIQIRTALITVLLLKAMNATAKYKWPLSNVATFIRLHIFVKISLQLWLDRPFGEPPEIPQESTRGALF